MSIEVDSIDYPLLSQIDSPEDLKRLPVKQLPLLGAEIRRFILEQLSQNSGHLGSNLGVVELTIALHYVFDTPSDLLVWDVGHQAYTHKILTGRKSQFDTLRKWGGLAGFPTPEESIYDTFAAGHASNSISAALGMAVAIARKNEHRHVVAILGDGSMTGGLAFEGLNNASSFPNNLLVILNDNNMSIDKNVGGLNKYLVNLLTSKTYNELRNDIYKGLKKLRILDDSGRRNIIRLNNRIKTIGSGGANFFDGFAIRYIGSIDGHDVERVVQVLQEVKNFDGPKILHLSTVKGHGYKPALANPTLWHAPGKFDVETGALIKSDSGRDTPSPSKFQDVFGHTLVELAELDERIVGVTPAMPTGCSMTYLMDKYPDRAYDVGIAEGHAVTFSSGLAREGLIPFCNIYSSFMQRAYDQLIHDVALIRSHVVFCLDRAGLVGEDGATHQGVFDLSYLRTIPNMVVVAPLDEIELRNMMYSAAFEWSGPIAIRYPRGKGHLLQWQEDFHTLPWGRGRKLKSGRDLAICSIGTIGWEVSRAIECLEQDGYSIAHYDLRFAKPLDEELLKEVFEGYDKIITVEENVLSGGVGEAIAARILDLNKTIKMKRLGIPDQFISHGTPQEQKSFVGLSIEDIVATAKELL